MCDTKGCILISQGILYLSPLSGSLYPPAPFTQEAIKVIGGVLIPCIGIEFQRTDCTPGDSLRGKLFCEAVHYRARRLHGTIIACQAEEAFMDVSVKRRLVPEERVIV